MDWAGLETDAWIRRWSGLFVELVVSASYGGAPAQLCRVLQKLARGTEQLQADHKRTAVRIWVSDPSAVLMYLVGEMKSMNNI